MKKLTDAQKYIRYLEGSYNGEKPTPKRVTSEGWPDTINTYIFWDKSKIRESKYEIEIID